MKKIFFAFVAFVFGIAQANAQSITFENVDLPENGQKELVVHYSTGGKTIVSYGFTIKLPKGLSFVMTDDGEPIVTYVGGKGVNLTYKDGNFGFLPKTDETQITGDGVLLKLTLQAGENLKQNDEFEVEVTSLGMTDSDLKDVTIANTQFTVKIVENRVTLNETDGITSETPTGTQNVRVNRTIKAGNWNTICLPFAMTAEQVKAAFGDGVQLADFIGCEGDGDQNNASTSIKVKFTAVDAIEANHPYLIKVETALTSFTADEVTISPNEASAKVQMDKTSGRNPVYNSFVGTYNPSTIIPVGGLFLNSNKFYYSNGTSKLKAFRAYFDFAVNWLEEAPYESKIWISIDGDATSIDGIGTQRVVEGVYDLSGRKIQLENGDLNKLQKGVYIIDGKKVTIK